MFTRVACTFTSCLPQYYIKQQQLHNNLAPATNKLNPTPHTTYTSNTDNHGRRCFAESPPTLSHLRRNHELHEENLSSYDLRSTGRTIGKMHSLPTEFATLPNEFTTMNDDEQRANNVKRAEITDNTKQAAALLISENYAQVDNARKKTIR